MDDSIRVTEWQEKPKQPKSDLASMGVYVFSKQRAAALADRGPRSTSAANVIPAMLDGGARVFGYRFDGYWQDVGTIQSYWEANMALLEDRPELDLYDRTGSSTPGPRSARRPRSAPTAPGPPEPDQPRLRDRRHGRQLGPVAGRPGRGRRGRPRLDRHVRLGHPVGRGRRPLDPRQGGRRRPGRDRRRRARLRRPRTARSRPA